MKLNKKGPNASNSVSNTVSNTSLSVSNTLLSVSNTPKFTGRRKPGDRYPIYPLQDVLDHYGFNKMWWSRNKEKFFNHRIYHMEKVPRSMFGRGKGGIMVVVNKPVINRIHICAAWKEICIYMGVKKRCIIYSDAKILTYIMKRLGTNINGVLKLIEYRLSEKTVDNYKDFIQLCLVEYPSDKEIIKEFIMVDKKTDVEKRIEALEKETVVVKEEAKVVKEEVNKVIKRVNKMERLLHKDVITQLSRYKIEDISTYQQLHDALSSEDRKIRYAASACLEYAKRNKILN